MAPFNVQRAIGLLERAITAPEPTGALRALTALREELDALERQQAARALREGKTFTAIAEPLGISRQAAHRRYRDLNPTPTLSAEARAALLRAREEAARHGSYSIDGQHLLLALAGTGALELDVDAARRSFAPPAINAQAPKGLHPALHARLARSSGPLRLQHLLRAALAEPGAQELLDRFGVTPVAPRNGTVQLRRERAGDASDPAPDANGGRVSALLRYRAVPGVPSDPYEVVATSMAKSA